MSKDKTKDSFLKGALILGIAGVAVKIIGAFFRIPLGNMIGSTGMGYYQSAYPVYTLFLTLATAGFPTAVAKLVSEKLAIGDERGANKVFKVSSKVLFITGIISFCIFFFGAEWIVTKFIKNPDALNSMRAIAPALIIVPLMSAYRGYFQGQKDMTKIAISQIVEQIFRVVLGLGLAYMLMKSAGPTMGAAGAISGAAIGALASIIYLLAAFARGAKDRRERLEKSKRFEEESFSRIFKNLLAVAIPITIGASVMPLVNMVDNGIVIRRLIAAGYSLKEANSMFGQLTGMAMSIINLPAVITTAMSMSLVPSISQAYALGNKEKARKDTLSAVKVTLIIVLPCAFGMASLAGPIMKLLFPAEPATVGTILFTLTPCVIFLGLIQTLTGILQGMGKAIVPVIALIVGMTFKITISYTLTAIPSINVLGSAIGTVTAYTVAAIINIAFVKKAMGVKFSKREFIIKPLITVISMFAAVKLAYFVTSPMLGNTIATLLSIIVGAVVYVVVLLGIGAITEEEIKTMPKGDKIYKLLKKVRLIK